MAERTQPDRTPEGYEDRPGRTGVPGDETGGQGAEFFHDATAGDGNDPDTTGESYLKAHGVSPEDT